MPRRLNNRLEALESAMEDAAEPVVVLLTDEGELVLTDGTTPFAPSPARRPILLGHGVTAEAVRDAWESFNPERHR